MKKSATTLAKIALIVCLLSNTVFASTFKEHYDMGQNYLKQYQYSASINEFKSALRINYLDNSARIGIINAYLSRGVEYANKDKAWNKAADDYRSALFYMVYYPPSDQMQSTASNINQVQANLERCLDSAGFEDTSENRFNTAKRLRAEGNFPAAAYEFNQALGSRALQKDSFRQVGEIMKIMGNEPKAAEYYKKALAVAPSDLELRLAYAKILDNIDSDDEALREYSYILAKVGNDDKDILYSLERTFDKKVKNSPYNANLNVNMGAILQKEGRLDEALSFYKQAETLETSNLDAKKNIKINKGTLFQQKGDYKTAIKEYESVLIMYPNDVKANLYRAQCYEKLGESKIAQDGFKKVLALDPNNEVIKSEMINNAKKLMDPEQFVEYVNTNMANMNPAGVIYDYAIELHQDGKIDNAIYLYSQALKLNTKDPEIYVNLALAQAQGNNYDQALNTLKIAQTNFPKDSTVASTAKNIRSMKTDKQMATAGEFYNNKDYKNAITNYLAVDPPTVQTMLGIATAYQELGDNNNALIYYKKALELKPLDSDIAYYIACLYGEKEDYDNAKIYLGKAISFNKNNTQAIEYLNSIKEMDKSNLLNNAIALYEANNYDESLVKFNEVLSMDKDNSYALYYRGMIYDTKEKRTEAIADLKRAYDLNKEFTICNYLIASDYDALGKYKDAYNYYLAYANSEVQDDEYKQYAKARAEELKEYAK